MLKIHKSQHIQSGRDHSLPPLGSLQVEQSPLQAASMYDSVGSHIPPKIKEKIWTGDYIELSLLLKSVKELVSHPQYSGELTIKG